MINFYKKFLEQIKKNKNKRVAFWGASLFLEKFLEEYSLEEYNILGIIDINKQRWGEKLGKYEIFSPDKIKELNIECVIISILNINKDIDSKIKKQIKTNFPKVKILKNTLLIQSHEEKLNKIKPILWLLDSLLPKNKKKLLFFSFPDFSDNAREYYEYLKKNHSKEHEMIWIYSDIKSYKNNLIENKFSISSLKGLWHILTSKYFIFTHTTYLTDIFNFKRHSTLQLWHGMPLKTLGAIEKNILKPLHTQYKDIGKYGNFFVSSDIFKLSMISCFLMDPNKIFITGQPKTDCILMNRNKDEISKFINKKEYNKVIIYAPTYKEALRNNKRDINKVFKNIFYCDDYSETTFYNFLEEKNILFIIKPHPFDEAFYSKLSKKGLLSHPNIKIVYDEDMKNNGYYFYDFFKFSDLMITDFSSIGIDYLISKKPIIFMCPTKDEYNNKRGFILEDNHEILMPGAKVENFADLIKEIEDSLTIDSWKNKRLEALPLLHKFADNKASERIYEIMKNL